MALEWDASLEVYGNLPDSIAPGISLLHLTFAAEPTSPTSPSSIRLSELVGWKWFSCLWLTEQT
jgi:hypothetical protein